MYKQNFLKECDRFERCCDYPGFRPNRNNVGLKQFHIFESKGIEPKEPDPYYTRLTNGKAWWEWTVNMYATSYPTRDWFGWEALAIDFKDDFAGYRQIADRIGCRERAIEIFNEVNQHGIS